jgi:hypothetical protein
MTRTRLQHDSSDIKSKPFVLDHHFTVDELEWNRIVGPSGLGTRLLEEMAALSTDVFALGDIERVSLNRGERLEFSIEGTSHQIEFEYDVPGTSTLAQGLRQLFSGVNTALRRSGVDWRYILIRERGAERAFDYQVLLIPRTQVVEHSSDYDIVAGHDLEDYEIGT